jgi:transcriptional regulator with XRE-family HTH domain
MGNIFFERFADLCKGIGETPNSVAKTLGISSGSVTAWKNGTEPRNKTLSAIADHFGVTTDYLLGKEAEKAPTGSGERDILDEVDLAFYGNYKELSEANKETLRAMARVLLEQENKG